MIRKLLFYSQHGLPKFSLCKPFLLDPILEWVRSQLQRGKVCHDVGALSKSYSMLVGFVKTVGKTLNIVVHLSVSVVARKVLYLACFCPKSSYFSFVTSPIQGIYNDYRRQKKRNKAPSHQVGTEERFRVHHNRCGGRRSA